MTSDHREIQMWQKLVFTNFTAEQPPMRLTLAWVLGVKRLSVDEGIKKRVFFFFPHFAISACLEWKQPCIEETQGAVMVGHVVSDTGETMKSDPGLLVLPTVWLKIYHVQKRCTAKYEDFTTLESHRSSDHPRFSIYLKVLVKEAPCRRTSCWTCPHFWHPCRVNAAWLQPSHVL